MLEIEIILKNLSSGICFIRLISIPGQLTMSGQPVMLLIYAGMSDRTNRHGRTTPAPTGCSDDSRLLPPAPSIERFRPPFELTARDAIGGDASRGIQGATLLPRPAVIAEWKSIGENLESTQY